MNEKLSTSGLIESLRLLASDSQTQIQSLPEFVQVPDELALIFHESMPLIIQDASDIVTPIELDVLLEIDQVLKEMSGQPDVWELHALQTDLLWDIVRHKAKKLSFC